MSYIFLKEPYGIVNYGKQVHIYNYQTQQTEKSFMFEMDIPLDNCSKLANFQIIGPEELMEEGTQLEKSILAKLVKDKEYIYMTDELSAQNLQNEMLMFDAEKIGMNYANSNEYNVKYKVFKQLKHNFEKTNMVVVGRGFLASKLFEELCIYPWSSIEIIEDAENEQFESVLKKDNTHIIYVQEDGSLEQLEAFNELMVNNNIPWTMMAVTNDKLFVGPTLYPHATGCIQCGFGNEITENYRNIMPYEANMMIGILLSDLSRVIGEMPEAIVEDISVTIGRAFCIDRMTLDGESIDIKQDIKCQVCGSC